MKNTSATSIPLQAWAASVPLALLLPLPLWIASTAILGDLDGETLVQLCMPIIIHFAAYLLTGLPIFLAVYRKPNSPVWKLPVALSLGTALGASALGLTFFGWGLHFILIGAGYGLLTAIAAYRQRPQLLQS